MYIYIFIYIQAPGRQHSANDRDIAKVEIPRITVNTPVNGDTQCVLHQDWWKTHWARAGFEPVTSRLQVGCSTNWATGQSTVRQPSFSVNPMDRWPRGSSTSCYVLLPSQLKPGHGAIYIIGSIIPKIMNVGLLCESAMKYQVPLTSLFSFSFLYVLLKNQNIQLII